MSGGAKVYFIILGAIASVVAGAAIGTATAPASKSVAVRSVAASKAVETIYVVNHATHYISNKEIKKDIPAW